MRFFLILLLASGCGSSGTNGGPDASGSDADNTVVDGSMADGNGGGKDAMPPDPTVLATGINYPFCIAADATNVFYCSGSSIFSVPIAGGPATKIASNPNNANNVSIAVGPNELYVIDYGSGIAKVPLPGGGWTWIANVGFNPGRGLVLAGSMLYWPADIGGWIMSLPVTGGMATKMIMGQGSPRDIVGDSTTLFWSNYQTGGIASATVPNGSATPVATAAYPHRTAIDANNVYFIGTAGNNFPGVLKVARTGGMPVEVYGNTTGEPLGEVPQAIAADGKALYVGTSYPNRIYKVGLSGGASMAAPESAAVFEILTDATNLYWIAGDMIKGATLKKIPKP